MKRLFLFACLLYIVFSCNNPAGSAKDALAKFLTAMQNSNYDEAKKYATGDSQPVFNMLSQKGDESQNIYKNKAFEIINVETHGNDAKAEVKFEPDVRIHYSLQNEGGAWKVNYSLSAEMDMLKDILKTTGTDVDKEVNRALDSIKINFDSLP